MCWFLFKGHGVKQSFQKLLKTPRFKHVPVSQSVIREAAGSHTQEGVRPFYHPPPPPLPSSPPSTRTRVLMCLLFPHGFLCRTFTVPPLGPIIPVDALTQLTCHKWVPLLSHCTANVTETLEVPWLAPPSSWGSAARPVNLLRGARGTP